MHIIAMLHFIAIHRVWAFFYASDTKFFSIAIKYEVNDQFDSVRKCESNLFPAYSNKFIDFSMLFIYRLL